MMDNSAILSTTVEPVGRVMIAHPEAGEIAHFPRSGQAAREYVPQLATVEYRLAGRASGVTFQAFMPCQVMLIGHGFYRELRLHTFTNLTGTLGPAVIAACAPLSGVLDEPGAYPAGHDLMQAMNSGVQGWFITPYRPETAVRLLWRLHALLRDKVPPGLTAPEDQAKNQVAGPRPN
jgi:hypothetical protein